MHKGTLDEEGLLGISMHVLFPGPECLDHLFHWRRDIGSSVECAARRAYPILTLQKVSWCPIFSAHPLHQTLVNFSHQPDADTR
jgi:hypothetical protein